MPIYEYECDACHEIVEVIQKTTDPAPEVCPQCQQAAKLTKQISKSAFVLKGEGWYVTDFRDNGKGKEASATSADDSGDKSSSTAASDSSPATSDSGSGSPADGDATSSAETTSAKTSSPSKTDKSD